MATTQTRPRAKPANREEAKKARRQQLIQATIACIARAGLSGTTMADITSEAGLSLGIVNLHFQSKEKLLEETLRSISEEYVDGWRKIGQREDLDNASRLQACIDFDFSSRICDRNKLAVWFAFMGESKARPTYQKICSAHETAVDETLEAICDALIAEGGYTRVNSKVIVRSYTALATGLWLDILVSPRAVDRQLGKRLSHDYFAAVFPRHFAPD